MYAASDDTACSRALALLGDEDTHLTTLFVALIQQANSRAHEAVQHETAQRISDLFDSEAQECASTYRFMLCLTKKPSAVPKEELGTSTEDGGEHLQDDIMFRLLRAIELTCDDLARVMLCRFLHGYLSNCKPRAAQRRLRCLLRLDGAIFVMRALVLALKDHTSTSIHLVAVDTLASLLLVISTRDGKFALKARLVGLIGAIHSRMFVGEELCTLALLRLMCRCIRSPRNAQLLGKYRSFPARIASHLDDVSSSMGESSSLKMARFAEILYFVSKNKKCRSAMLDEMVIPVVKRLFERHFEMGLRDACHLELCLISLACLRQLSKTKRGRDQLISNGALEMCERAINSVADDRRTLSPQSPIVTPLLQLQDSLCALCMRCLPVKPFPLCSSSPLVSFALSPFRSTVAVRLSASKFPSGSNRISATPLPSDGLLDDAPSSDDDGGEEEEDNFLRLGLGPNVEALHPDEDDEGDTAPSLAASPSPFSFSRQRSRELRANYGHIFTEYLHGAHVPHSSPKSSTSKARRVSYSQMITVRAQQTNSVIPFVKIAFPEYFGPNIELELQPLHHNDDSIREMVTQEMRKSRKQSEFLPRIVFDLDRLLEDSLPSPKSSLKNNDKTRIGKMEAKVDHLLFESRFEGGNLRRVTQVGVEHYELILSPDINQTRSHYQWFYFEVSNNEPNVQYTFEVINCVKSTSMFSKGMQPVLFSVTEACRGRPGWVRIGSSISYYRNLYAGVNTPNDSVKKSGTSKKTKCSLSSARNYFSIRFTINFQHAADVCYIAYHFPYTYSFLQTSLESMDMHLNKVSSAYMRTDKLCDSLAGNAVPVVTITAAGTREEVERREIVIFSARVHPGESNASWMMHGVVEFLLSAATAAAELRKNFVFKLVPMLNPDGVVNGNHRCSLAGIDLNRVWDRPSASLHPTVFHAKGIVQFMVDILKKKPFVFVDFHGHSRRYNVFMFGNNPEESWRSADHTQMHDNQFMLLPELLEQSSDSFSFAECLFSIAKAKEPSARVVVWRQFNIPRVHTMEATYCGFDAGRYAGYQVGIAKLKEMGRDLCMALLPLKKRVDAENTALTKISRSGHRRANSESGIASELYSS
uniref:Cytosolic carboxypeptidase 1 n=2 Tax=Parascaris univalens TaxID=6257 RepID=A0A914ZSG6_PARUN